MKRTYEILGYKTKEDFTERNFQILNEGITNKKEVLKEARNYIFNEPYAIIKVQSSDREFIQILDKYKDFELDLD